MRRLFTALIFAFTCVAASAEAHSPDLVIYGATPAGIMAAIAAAQEGLKVTIAEPGKYIGGMLTGGLSHTDYGDRTVIGGLAADFYKKVAEYYHAPLFYWRGPEPKVAEQILTNWLERQKVQVLFGKRLERVEKNDGIITELFFLDGTSLKAKVFIDAGYEGDLMAKARVSYTYGRESKKEYNEKWAGRQPVTFTSHQIDARLSPYRDGPGKQLLPLINRLPMAEIGEADGGIQSYCFRMIGTDKTENMVPWPKPLHYDTLNFELVKRYYKERPDADPLVRFIPTLPNGKSDINSSAGISTNLLDGSSWRYPEADYRLRDSLWQWHKDYVQGLVYFLANDSSIPARVREKMKLFGLCKDEYTDNGNFPHQLYVREARRMKGEYFMTEHDLEDDTVKYDAIGMGSYNMDVREMQRSYISLSRFPELVDEVYNEGYLSIPVAQYQIPYRALLPKFNECRNLLVPVCLSASHMAFASIRMEPQFMIMGHAAGIAAALAVRQKTAVQQVDVVVLQKKLKAARQVISLAENPYGLWNSPQDVIIDNNMKGFTSFTGKWTEIETKPKGRYEMNFRSKPQGGAGTFTFRPYLFRSGQYDVFCWSPADEESAAKVPLNIGTADGIVNASLNQHDSGKWVKIGRYRFVKGSKSYISIVGEQDSLVNADAVRFCWVDN
ncbi:FAD-dependent oxidoreductase [Mucilaginibacter sp. RS28]|uniref:FAD-dependent oxidoreductase n=1 Tax=Mucilaginibacter straminoryzae TaxID=2932774 RepID=A0A9X1X1P1_9SPHI|nr:FAD-dependent oxidoreductase [Mucilaginibacter straminoryzae]MCJ8209001.1 FAD-dependent oxidoreductase [Mucilaginibacter straminoryzae]